MSRGHAPDRTPMLIGAVVAGGGAALAGAFLAFPPPLDRQMLTRALLLVAITAAAELIAIQLRHGDEAELITLFEMALVANIVLLPVSAGAGVSVAGLAVALLIQRRSPVKALYNIGGYALAAVVAAGVFETFRGSGGISTAQSVGALTAGMAAFTGVNLLTISAVLSATTGRPLRRILAEQAGISMAIGVGNGAVGMVAVALYVNGQHVLVPAVLAPAVALHMAFRGWIKEKELSQEMQEEKTKLERIVQHSSEGIVLAAGDGTVLLWSPSMERITGIGPADAEGKALPFLLRGTNQFGRPVSVDVSDDAEPVEIEILTPAGQPRWVRVQHGAGRGTGGALAFDVLVVHDVTRQRETERMKDDFVATVSHELRTPLTPIKGYASLLLRRGDQLGPERSREALQSIVERTDHMARLVEDLLLASQFGRGDRRLPHASRERFDAVEPAEKVLRTFRLAHGHRTFSLDGAPSLTAIGDPLRFEQVLAHLLSNAVTYSEDGMPVSVTIEESADGTGVVLSVRDEGRGIPADKHEEIFEKFRRLEDPLVMQTGGAGLGLFIVRQLVTAMGGEVSVVSAPGEGSTFTVRLQAAPAQAAGGSLTG